MAATTTAFETEINTGGFPSAGRSLMAGPAYKLRDAYQRGVTDPTAHQLAKQSARQLDALTRNGKMASFDAITGP
jgi:hypothetical protein